MKPWPAPIALAWVLLGVGCNKPDPESKVQRWASQVMATQDAAEPDAPTEPAPGVPRIEPSPQPSGTAPCDRLVVRACRGLGPFSEECAEARAVIPSHRTLDWTQACLDLADEYASYLVGEGRGRGPHPCKVRMTKTCSAHGLRSWECRGAKAESARLGRSGRRDTCLGDLLLWELKQVAQAIAASR